MKKIALTAAAILACALPLAANAQTAADLAAQVQTLIAQINALQTHMGVNAGPPPTAPQMAQSAVCPQLYRTLSRGAQGPDVLNLQAFLAADTSANYTGGLTGFFGPVTERAVQNWQSANSIVSYGDPSSTGWGVVGARTRAAIALSCTHSNSPFPQQPTCPTALPPTTLCSTGWKGNIDQNGCTTSFTCAIPLPGGGTQNTCNSIALSCPAGKHDQVGANCSHACVDSSSAVAPAISAYPTTGAAPLSVSFTGTVSGTSYTLDYGDGSTPLYVGCSGGCLSTQATPINVMHTYAMNGTYIARLTAAGVTSSATITVGTGNSYSFTTSISATSVFQGDGISISWSSQNVPSGAAVGLWLQDSGGNIKGLIAGTQSSSGQYTWIVPGPQCNASGQCLYQQDSPAVYFTAPGPYRILARLYTPSNAYLGGYSAPNPVYPTYLATAQSAELLVNSK